ncbi:MAG: c-type cytochrome [Parafilimonas sp.]|nr:c-type cytochrome [Parafilimonas sp.]
MFNTKPVITSVIIIALLVCVIKNFAARNNFVQQQNHVPVVKIISPANNNTVKAGSQIHYEVSVSDKEDGESKYDEIDTKQVLLEVKYVSDASKLASNIAKEQDAPGLAAIKTSNCFNCHGFNTKVIGPSFNDINKKYKPTAANMALLQKRIKEGSVNVWGKTAMPTHPELSDAQIKNMVQWIMQNASAAGVQYSIGLEGNFILPSTNTTGGYVITASYTDHGVNNAGQRLQGKDAITVKLN